MKKNTLKLKSLSLLLLFCVLSVNAQQITVTVDSRDPNTDAYIGGEDPTFSNLEQTLLKTYSATEIAEITDLKVTTTGTYTFINSREQEQTVSISIEPSDFVFLNAMPKLANLDLSDATITSRTNNSVDNTFPRSAFESNKTIKSITLPKNLASLSRNAFSNTAIEGTFTIPKGVANVSEYDMIFGGSSGISGFAVEAGNAKLKTVDGILYTITGDTLLVYPFGKTNASFVMPEGVTHIGTSAFGWNNYLEELTLASTIDTLPRQDKIINNSTKVKAIYVAEGNTKYGSTNGFLVDKTTATLMAFPPANTDETITIDGSIVKVVPSGYFSYAVANLKNIIFTEGVEEIGYTAFKIGTDVTSVLEYIELPSTTKNIGGEAFVGNGNLLQVICRAEAPPAFSDPNQIFRGSNGKDVRLGVPAKSVDAYKNSTWNINSNIMGIYRGQETNLSANANAFPADQIVAYGNITIENGTCLQSASAPNFSVKVIANEAPEGDAFAGWVSEPAVSFVNPKASVGTFTMPGSDVTIRATFSAKLPYTIINAITQSGEAPAGGTVNIEADATKDGQLFRYWEIIEGEGLVIDNPNAISTSFTMVEGTVTIAARYATAYMINITGGTAVLEAFEKETVTIKASPKANQEFVNWTTTTSNVVFDNANSATTTFVMPASEVNITANFREITGVNNISDSFGLYPNPATDYIQIIGASNLDYTLYDVFGKSLMKGVTDGEPISIGGLQGGIYLFEINGEIIKFIKK